jgi:hypothetical protein
VLEKGQVVQRGTPSRWLGGAEPYARPSRPKSCGPRREQRP